MIKGSKKKKSEDPLGQQRTWLIGRSRPCEIIFDDDSISRKHSQIVETGEGFYMSDLRSANGTFINGYRLTGETRIYEEDEIRLGNVQFRFTEDMLR